MMQRNWGVSLFEQEVSQFVENIRWEMKQETSEKQDQLLRFAQDMQTGIAMPDERRVVYRQLTIWIQKRCQECSAPSPVRDRISNRPYNAVDAHRKLARPGGRSPTSLREVLQALRQGLASPEQIQRAQQFMKELVSRCREVAYDYARSPGSGSLYEPGQSLSNTPAGPLVSPNERAQTLRSRPTGQINERAQSFRSTPTGQLVYPNRSKEMTGASSTSSVIRELGDTMVDFVHSWAPEGSIAHTIVGCRKVQEDMPHRSLQG
eukprot:gb/GEZN01012215.1/.p1 GENE.gb/GEZN01012215.1/~~gb/GEZN01012215.1/.p1  ORF type:complete len:263 (+),score=23.08 gb/GEZN01012215.1/:36-824(+)